MRTRLSVAYDGACTTFSYIGRYGLDVNTQLPERLDDQFRVCPSCEAGQDDVAAELPEHASDVAALPAGLSEDGPAALHFFGLEVLDFKNAVQHRRKICIAELRRILPE